MIAFDIETIPCNNKETIARLADGIKPPGNIKKPESIKTWMEENYDKALAEVVAKTSLDGAYGRVACIGWSVDGCQIYTTTKDTSERDAINDFYAAAKDHDMFLGHNIAGFDLPFLKHRSMVLGIKPPATVLRAMTAKPWDDVVGDTMYMWTNDRNKYISLDTLCWIFDIDGKGGFDGSMVAETWPVDPQKVIDYCADDVSRAIAVYEKITFGAKVF